MRPKPSKPIELHSRVRLNALGRMRHPKTNPDRWGRVVGMSKQYATAVQVLWDGSITPQAWSKSLLEPDMNEGTKSDG